MSSSKGSQFLRSNVLGLVAIFIAATGTAVVAEAQDASSAKVTDAKFKKLKKRVAALEGKINAPATGDLNGTYPNLQLNPNSVTTGEIANNAVTTDKLADNAVTNPKVADNAINSAEIATNAVNTTEIATIAWSTRRSRTTRSTHRRSTPAQSAPVSSPRSDIETESAGSIANKRHQWSEQRVLPGG